MNSINPPDPESTVQYVAVIDAALEEARELAQPDEVAYAANKLEIEPEILGKFIQQHRYLFNFYKNVKQGEVPIEPPTQDMIRLGDGERPSEEQLAKAVELADQKLERGLRKMGLNEAEIQEWMACQEFNRDHFSESMDMVNATVAREQLMLSMEAKKIRERLKEVRSELAKYEMFPSDERKDFVKEEKSLVYQLVAIGELMRGNQDTWFRGAAALAMIRMRWGDKEGGGMKRVKPGFRAHDRVEAE